MRPSRKELAAHLADRGARIKQLVRERDDHKRQALANVSALRRTARELSDLKDAVALHIAACRHPSSTHLDAHSGAVALLEDLETRGINLRVELARLEGSHL